MIEKTGGARTHYNDAYASSEMRNKNENRATQKKRRGREGPANEKTGVKYELYTGYTKMRTHTRRAAGETQHRAKDTRKAGINEEVTYVVLWMEYL